VLSTATWRASQSLAVQSVTPRWATGAQGLFALNSRHLGMRAATLTAAPPSHPLDKEWFQRKSVAEKMIRDVKVVSFEFLG